MVANRLILAFLFFSGALLSFVSPATPPQFLEPWRVAPRPFSLVSCADGAQEQRLRFPRDESVVKLRHCPPCHLQSRNTAAASAKLSHSVKLAAGDPEACNHPVIRCILVGVTFSSNEGLRRAICFFVFYSPHPSRAAN